MRGRLINPFTIELAQLDTLAMSKDPDGVGPKTKGYDDVFREPVLLPQTSGEGAAIVHRKEKLTRAHAQVEIEKLDAARALAAGIAPGSLMRLVFHYEELEALGMLDPNTCAATIRIGDRVEAIWSCDGATLIRRFPNPPGLFVVAAEDMGFGFGGTRNLLLVTVQPRERGPE